MVRGLHAAYDHYNRDPRSVRTLPGQFSEWFEGESLINRGMKLSPWEPPRFLWAAMEGVCGLMVQPDAPGIRPLVPPDWRWVAAARVAYHGSPLTFFAVREGSEMRVYSNTDFKNTGAKEILPDDLTDRVRVSHGGMHPVALSDGERTLVAVGSCREQVFTTPLYLHDILEPDTKYELRHFTSEEGSWSEPIRGTGGGFADLAVRISAGGYRLLDFRRL
jgi:hypothetical protein